MFIKSITQAYHHQNQSSITQANHHQNQPTKKRKVVEEDDSEETLELLLKWISDTSDISPEKIVGDSVGRCSKPIRKQLMESDVKEDQNRLMLGKLQVEKLMFTLLEESEIPRGKEGIRVLVYGPDEEANEMMFKMWSSEKTPVLTCGWNKFVRKYELKMHCDFLMIRMFRHRETRKICFAIESTRLPITKKLSRRISKIVFKVEDSD
ncbi:unnamed protein product [Arabis nemorensis]|uniref:TF-B3 domain-containing protein n=1 Tax=Arabis nemorensis TaxID=586526 RepID=A0A565BMF1_9BRAS|nr:unnamed protein product [Arabis nemorensis]